ncbi:LysR family transcriptional regulator [Streptomyces sp. BA2]|uniref:LysR family transcriptional regulator n=1 Tax=Streptomyces sp. BA2 TaxID=436595 RepID=UPI0013221FAD|nr:LysR family transcriptional regulator [Streptomyces sp. BA2]MWA08240.1 LysR family transcriptional regulator [Streptomyces sp. BA2]
MDIRQLEYFLAIVDHGGFNRAASALYLSQPSLSQSVQGLERDLGASLFHRIGRRVVLTEAGSALIEPARAAVRSLETARASVAAVHELREGRLDIAAMPSQAVEPLTTMIRTFSSRYPGVSVNIRAAFTSRDVVDMVRTGAAELGLLATSVALPDKEVVSHAVGEQRFVLLTPPCGPFPAGRPVNSGELAGHRLIVGQRGTGMRAYVDGLREEGVDFHIAAETEHRVAILPLVLAGVGLAVVTESWRTTAEQAGAIVLDIEPKMTLRVALVARRAQQSPAAQTFLSCALGAAQAS